MDFKDLSYVIAIAEQQSITKAANSLYLSQPTLSIFLQNLEKQIGQKLFQKSGNKFLLTYAGECYVEKAYQILALKKELDDTLQEIKDIDRGILRIGCPPVLGTAMLPETLAQFRTKFPNVKVHIAEKNTSELKKMLLDNTLDLVFMHSPIKSANIAQTILHKEELLLMMSAHHPAAANLEQTASSHPWIDLSKLKEESYIVQAQGHRTRQLTDQLFRQYDICPKNVMETSTLRTTLALVEQNLGLAFMINSYLHYIPSSGDVLACSFGKESITVDFLVSYQKGKALSAYAKEYIEIVQKWRETLGF